MSGQKTEAATEAAQISQEEARRFQDLALPYLGIRNNLLYEALAGKAPGMDQAFAGQRSAIAEQGFQNERTQLQSLLAQGKGAVAGGNYQQLLQGTNGQVGEALATSRLNQALAPVEQRQKILAMLMGQNVQSANQAVQAGAGQLQAINMFPDYNRGVAVASALGSLGYTAYQAWPQGRGASQGGMNTNLPYQSNTPAWQGGFGGGRP